MVHLVYEKKLKRRVPSIRPDYVQKAFDCFYVKLQELENPAGAFRIASQCDCNLSWLCRLFGMSAFEASLRTITRKVRR